MAQSRLRQRVASFLLAGSAVLMHATSATAGTSPGGIFIADRSAIGAGGVGQCAQKTRRVAEFLSGIFGTPFEQKEKEMALAAARQAHEAGYNWILLSPLKATSERRSASYDKWVTVGFEYGFGGIASVVAPRTVTTNYNARYYFMDCLAVDDIGGYELLFGDSEGVESTDPWKLYSVYDVDAALGPLVEGNSYRPIQRQEPRLGDQRLTQPGQREKLTALLGVMQKTEQCMRANMPDTAAATGASLEDTDMETVFDCWTALTPEATQVGWRNFPLFVAAANALQDVQGYVDRSDRQSASASREAWFPVSSPYILAEGQVWFGRSGITSDSFYAYVVSDSPLSEQQALDAVVFYSSEYIMSSRYRGIGMNRIDTPTDPNIDYGLKSDLWQHVIALGRAGKSIKMYQVSPVADIASASRDYEITAEKLQAYNTVGSRLFGSAFEPFSTPVGY